MKKQIIILVLLSMIIPQITFAAWWNPFTWKIFNRTVSTTESNIVETTKLSPEIQQLIRELEEVRKIESKASTTVSIKKNQPQVNITKSLVPQSFVADSAGKQQGRGMVSEELQKPKTIPFESPSIISEISSVDVEKQAKLIHEARIKSIINSIGDGLNEMIKFEASFKGEMDALNNFGDKILNSTIADCSYVYKGDEALIQSISQNLAIRDDEARKNRMIEDIKNTSASNYQACVSKNQALLGDNGQRQASEQLYSYASNTYDKIWKLLFTDKNYDEGVRMTIDYYDTLRRMHANLAGANVSRNANTNYLIEQNKLELEQARKVVNSSKSFSCSADFPVLGIERQSRWTCSDGTVCSVNVGSVSCN